MRRQDIELLASLINPDLVGSKVATGGTASITTSTFHGNGMFSYCGGNELISSFVPDDMLSTWLGTTPSIVDPDFDKIISWIGPHGTEDGSCTWNRTASCEDAPKVEWGKCELITCFGEIAHAGQDLKLTRVGLARCDEQPVYYIRGPHAGMQVRNDQEWQIAVAAGVLRMAFERMLVVGNHTANALDFDGLMVLVNQPITDARTGTRCQGEEPYIYDWNNAAASSNICNILNDIVRRIRRRAMALGGVQRGDMVLVMTSLMRDALIDYMACGCGPCSGSQYNEVNVDPMKSREERARLMQDSTYGMGMVEVDGVAVDIITNDWIPQTSNAPYFCSDIFVLTRRVGVMRTLYMEHQDFATTLKNTTVPINELVDGARVTDGGRFMLWSNSVNECFNQTVLTKARVRMRAPWLLGRITNVCAPFNLPPETSEPCDEYFWAGNPPANVADGRVPYFYSGCQELAGC